METQEQTKTLTHHFGVSAPDHVRIIRRIAKDHGMDEGYATTVFEETTRFLEMCAAYPKERLAPSEEVDKGWHTFLLYTKAYRAFCKSLGRSFIDHEPNDLTETKNPTAGSAHCGVNCRTGCDYVSAIHSAPSESFGGTNHTVSFMEANRIVFNRDLWPKKIEAADCVPDPCTCEGSGTYQANGDCDTISS